MSWDPCDWCKTVTGVDPREEINKLENTYDAAKAAVGQAYDNVKTEVKDDYDKAKAAVGNAYDKGKATVADQIKKGARALGIGGKGGGGLSLGGSVGRSGKNNPDEVKAVQRALGIQDDGKCGPGTIKAIEGFQRSIGQAKPDGRVDPGGATARALASADKLGPSLLDKLVSGVKDVIKDPSKALANSFSGGSGSDDYKQGYQDGFSGDDPNPAPRDGDALTDYNEGYAKGHDELSKQPASGSSTATFTEADRIAALERNYAGWLAEGNWPLAAEALNGFNQQDIANRLAELTPEKIENLHQGAIDNPRVGPQSQVAQMTVRHDSIRADEEDVETRERGREVDSITTEHGPDDDASWFQSDWAGRAILARYLAGGGDWTIKRDARWSAYMRANPSMGTKLKKHALSLMSNVAALGPDAGTIPIGEQFPMQIENGEGIVGYQYLHGTNADAGGFEIQGWAHMEPPPTPTEGTLSTTDDRRVHYYLEYTWNDIIDPNPKYNTDIFKDYIARAISLGKASSYQIAITWSGEGIATVGPNGEVIALDGSLDSYPLRP